MILAWILVRYEFPGRRLIDTLIDLPFAIPTAVSGIALCAIFANNGWIDVLAPWGIELAYNPIGIVIALTFIGLPFVVRTLQPVLKKKVNASWKKQPPVWGPTACKPLSASSGLAWYRRY